MQIGESAGFAFALAKKADVAPALLDTRLLVRTLVTSRSMVSFFNDVDVALAGPAAFAAQVFATRGFFHDYNARLEDPLKEATAQIWLQSLQVAMPDDATAQKTAEAVAQAESGDSEVLSVHRWQALLTAAGHKAGKSPSEGTVTRGQALAALWEFIE